MCSSFIHLLWGGVLLHYCTDVTGYYRALTFLECNGNKQTADLFNLFNLFIFLHPLARYQSITLPTYYYYCLLPTTYLSMVLYWLDL